jgi:hypothetical protein
MYLRGDAVRYITPKSGILCFVKEKNGQQIVLLQKQPKESLAAFEKRCAEYGKSNR